MQSQLESLKKTAEDLQISGLAEAFDPYAEVYSDSEDSRNATAPTIENYQNVGQLSPSTSTNRKRRRRSAFHIDGADESANVAGTSGLNELLTNATQAYLPMETVKVEPDEQHQTWLITGDPEVTGMPQIASVETASGSTGRYSSSWKVNLV